MFYGKRFIYYLLVLCCFWRGLYALEDLCEVAVTVDMDGDGREEIFHSFSYTPMDLLGALSKFPQRRGRSLIYDMALKRTCSKGQHYSRHRNGRAENCLNGTSFDLALATFPLIGESNISHYLFIGTGQGVRTRIDSTNDGDDVAIEGSLEHVEFTEDFYATVHYSVSCRVLNKNAFPSPWDRWSACEMCAGIP